MKIKEAELKEAIAKYIESKELVLMGYLPEYIDDVKTDMEIAFRAGAEWMSEQGEEAKWKPSDEQLRPLEYAIDYFKKKRNDTTYLESLYNDLKKL